MELKNIVFFGTRSTGLDFLKVLYDFHNEKQLHLVGVYTVSDRWRTKCWWLSHGETDPVERFCANSGIRIFEEMKEIIGLKLYAGITVSFPRVLSRDIFCVPILGFINFDAAPLPEYRGQCSPSFAIMEDNEYFGCTFIKVDESLDTGPIYLRKTFAAPKGIDAYTLDRMAYEEGLKAFPELLEQLIDDQLKAIPQSSLGKPERYFSRKQLYPLLECDLGMSKVELEKRILALTFPRVLPAPYIMIKGKKFNIIPSE